MTTIHKPMYVCVCVSRKNLSLTPVSQALRTYWAQSLLCRSYPINRTKYSCINDRKIIHIQFYIVLPLYDTLRISKSIESGSRLVVAGLWVGGRLEQWLWIGIWFLWEIIKMLWNQIVVMVVWPCKYSKNHWSTHFKWGDSMGCAQHRLKNTTKNTS